MSAETRQQIKSEIIRLLPDGNKQEISNLVEELATDVATEKTDEIWDSLSDVAESNDYNDLDNIIIRQTSRNITAAELKALATTAIQIIDAPGAGKAVEVLSASLKFTANDGLLELDLFKLGCTGYAPNPLGGHIPQLQIASGFDPTEDSFQKFNGVASTGTDNQLKENHPISLWTANDSAAGTSTAIIYVTYRIITLEVA